MLNGSQTRSKSLSADASKPAGAESSTPFACPQFVAVSAALRRLLLRAEITLPRMQYATLEGEPGTGKHLLAQTIHRLSDHAHLSFHRCDAREWLATEAEPSALTGTLYLDRVDLLAPAGQGLLLNLIKMLHYSGSTQDEVRRFEVRRLNDSSRSAKFLVLVSTNTSLRQLASEGHFLPDLAFRLTAVHFPLPPLREHREDIAPITQALIDRICRRYQQPTAVMSPGSLPRLLQHSWPGNVRELASVLETAILDSTTGILRPTDFSLHTAAPPKHDPGPVKPDPAEELSILKETTLDAIIHRHIQLVLGLNRGNKLRAARQLGISRSTLYRLLAGETIPAEAMSERTMGTDTLPVAGQRTEEKPR